MHDSYYAMQEINGDRIEYYDPNDPEIIPVPSPPPSPHPSVQPHHNPHTYPIPEPEGNHSLFDAFFMTEGFTFDILVCMGALMFIGVYAVKCYDNYRGSLVLLRSRRRLDRIDVDNLNTLILCEDLPEETCSVCLEDFKDGDTIKKLNCNHIFHKDCLQPWLNEHDNCPMCRQNII